MGRKQCAKMRNLLVTSNFSFSHSVFKRVVLQTRKNQGLFGKGLTNPQCILGSSLSSSPYDKFLNWSKLKALADDKLNVSEKLKFVLGRVEIMMEKGENACLLPAFSPFPVMFSKGLFVRIVW